jgi:hypothetical protein
MTADRQAEPAPQTMVAASAEQTSAQADMTGASDASWTAIRAALARLAADGDRKAAHMISLLILPPDRGIDDAAALTEIATLEAAGKKRAAVSIVARRHFASTSAIAAAERRYRRKRRSSKI